MRQVNFVRDAEKGNSDNLHNLLLVLQNFKFKAIGMNIEYSAVRVREGEMCFGNIEFDEPKVE